MKLVACGECNDIFGLIGKLKYCRCGASAGMYNEDALSATIYGDSALALGMYSGDIRDALIMHNELLDDEDWGIDKMTEAVNQKLLIRCYANITLGNTNVTRKDINEVEQ